VSALSDRINDANTSRMSSREIETEAKKLGADVSHGAINLVLNGKHGDVKDKTLRALSKVFRIPFGELRELLGLPSIDEPWEPPENAARLSPQQRRMVEALINELTRPRVVTVTPPEDVDAEEQNLSSVESRPS
jgi:hypothetical protein